MLFLTMILNSVESGEAHSVVLISDHGLGLGSSVPGEPELCLYVGERLDVIVPLLHK